MSHRPSTVIPLVKHANGKEVMEKMTKEAIIQGLGKFRPFEMGDDPGEYGVRSQVVEAGR